MASVPTQFDKLRDPAKLDRFKRSIAYGQKWRQSEGYDDLWKKLADAYRLKTVTPDGQDPEDAVQVQIGFSTINTIEPSVAVNKPKTWVFARDSDNEDRAAIAEAVINSWWQTGVTHAEFRASVKDSLIFGLGWAKVGYRFRQEAELIPDDERAAMAGVLNEKIDAAAVADPEGALAMPTPDEATASIPEMRTKTVEDRPFVERVSPKNVFVDPSATSQRDMRWIAQRSIRSWEAVVYDERYDKSARRKVRPTLKAADQHEDVDRQESVAGEAVERQQVIVWEFYDVEHSTVAVFADGCDEFLVKPTKMPYTFGHPFVMIPGYEVPDTFYPIGDLEAILPLQHELNETRTQMMQARRHFVRKFFVRKGVLSKQARASLESANDGETVEIDHEGPLSEVMAQVPTPSIPAELFNMTQVVEGNIDLVSGVSDYQRGSAPEIRRTATEAALIQDAVNARTADRLAKIERAIADISKRLLCLARQYLTEEQVARVVGKNGRPIWIPYEHDDLDFEADFEVEAGSTQPKNEAFKQQQANQLMQVAMPFIEAQIVDPKAVFVWVLQQFGVKNPEQFLSQGPPPMPPGMAPPGMGPPGGDPHAPAPDGAPVPPDGGQAPPADMAGIPPEILAQLAGQVGLNLPPGA